MSCNGILTGHMVITKAMLDELTLKHCEGAYEWVPPVYHALLTSKIMIPICTNGRTVKIIVQVFFESFDERPRAVTELLKGAHHVMGYLKHSRSYGDLAPEDLPDFRLSLSKVLYAIRMPHLMAAKIQRKYRNWKSCDREGKMLMISCSNDLEDTMAMIGVDRPAVKRIKTEPQ